MKILRLLASIVLIAGLIGCSRPERPAQVAGAPRLQGKQASITQLETTRGLVCARCHTALTVDTDREPAIRFSHEKHQDMGAHCNECHRDLAHAVPGQVHGPGIMPGHPQCFVCHNGKRAPNNCDWCHLSRGQQDPHPPNFLTIHDERALANPANCRQCHNESFCQHCHTMQMPHPRGWIGVHGERLSQGDCVRCHSPQYCNQCHQRTRPVSHQRKDFRQIHGDIAVLGSNCIFCHSKQFCSDCHKLPMPHPSDWTSKHAAQGKADNQVCTRCHDINTCRSCHERRKILGHPSEFLMPHITETRKDANPDCRVCHSPAYCGKCHPNGINGKIFPGGK